MKVFVKAPEELLEGVKLLGLELGYTLCEESEAELVITAEKSEENIVKIDMAGGVAKVVYGGGNCRFNRALGLIFEAIADGKKEFSKEEHPLFETNGSFFDCSRNAVLNVKTVKDILRKTALMGMSTFMLYTEDTFEVPEEPYFGHMRGRYTKEELQDIDQYAIKLGIEVIPCIELLGHMEMFLKWASSGKYRDTANVLLVGSENTYKLVYNMVKALREGLSSNRLLMGLDEAYDLGRGSYLSKNGYREPTEIFCEHLVRIVEIVKSFGYQPMMYSDMFFHMASKLNIYKDLNVEFPQEVLDKVPEGVQQVYWDYGTEREEFYQTMLEKHAPLGDNTFFLGGVITYLGPCPEYGKSFRVTLPALEACKNSGTKEVMITAWHNGAESSLVMALPFVLLYAEYDYNGYYDEAALAKRFKFLCGADVQDFYDMEKADQPHIWDSDDKTMSVNDPRFQDPMYKREVASRFLLFNDPLIGLLDYHVRNIDVAKFYREMVADYANRGTTDGLFGPAFDYFKRLLEVLEVKSDFGVRLKKAHDAGDKEALAKLSADAEEIERRLDILRKSHRASWMFYNKAFGFEIFDSYYGSLMARCETVRYRIEAFLNGEIDKIEELCEDRIPFGYSNFGESDGEAIFYDDHFINSFTPGVYR